MSNAQLSTILEPVVARHGLELDEVEVIPAGRRFVVRITVDGDGPKGRGPMMDDIAEATLAISEALDAADPLPGAYTLEVSSRGVSKPLTQAKHYRRNRGRLVKANLTDGSQLIGRIVDVEDEGDQGVTVTLEVTPESVKGNRTPKPERHRLGLDQIAKAVVQIEMNRSNADDEFADGEPSDDELADDELADEELADDLGDEADDDQDQTNDARDAQA